MVKQIFRTGWIPDYPDFRDYTADNNDQVRQLLQAIGIEEGFEVDELPEYVDLYGWCSPIEHQGKLGSCSAQAAVGLVEFFERRAFGKYINASRLFLYKVTRKLAGIHGDCGATLRDTMKALALFGVPPEGSWPYIEENFDEEPTAFCYALAQNYQAEVYYRLDPPGISLSELLRRIKVLLSQGSPSMFGFTCYASMDSSVTSGEIPMPSDNEPATSAHAVVAVGYQDNFEIRHPMTGTTTTGALHIRNSWGEEWGDAGYGWLPYDYILEGITSDWWTLLKQEWVDTDVFSA
jgi:C1A family cysteine protease